MSNKGRVPGETASSPDRESIERLDVRTEVADRLRHRGVRLTGAETEDEVADLLNAVELFERAVQASGGDLMVDEPIGNASPTEPDSAAFVLPARHSSESVAAFIERIAHATSNATKRRR